MAIIPPPTHNEVLPLSLSIMICLLMTCPCPYSCQCPYACFCPRCRISAHADHDLNAQSTRKAQLSDRFMLTCVVKMTRSTTIWTQKSPRKPGLAIEVPRGKHEIALEEHVWPRMSFSYRKMKGCKQPLKASETKH